MKFKDLVVAGAALLVVYKAGQVSGHVECFNELMGKYGKELLENHGEIISKINKHFTIKVIKTSK